MSGKDDKPGKKLAINQRVGRNLRHYRVLAKVTPAELAKHMGVTVKELAKYETGEQRFFATQMTSVLEFFNQKLDVVLTPRYFFEERDAGADPQEPPPEPERPGGGKVVQLSDHKGKRKRKSPKSDNGEPRP